MLKRNSTKPRIHTIKDAYQDYASRILEENEDYWGKSYNNIKNYHIYKMSDGCVLEVTSYDKYRYILEEFFKLVGTELIEGKSFYLGNRNGELRIKRIERNFSTARIDWGESNKLKQHILDKGETLLEMIYDDKGNIIGDNGGKKWLVYYTDEEYFRLAWIKPHGRHGGNRNLKFYKFSPARGTTGHIGFKEYMSKVISLRPELKDRYRFYKLKRQR